MEGISALFKLVKLINELGREVRRVVGEASVALDHSDEAHAARLWRTYRRIIRITAATVVVGFIFVPCVSPWVGVWAYGIKAADAPYRMVMGVLLSLLPCYLYLFAGVALGCLTAPAEFLDGPAGAVWMDLIGTTSITVARVVCVIVVTASIAVMAGVAFLIITMAPFVR